MVHLTEEGLVLAFHTYVKGWLVLLSLFVNSLLSVHAKFVYAAKLYPNFLSSLVYSIVPECVVNRGLGSQGNTDPKVAISFVSYFSHSFINVTKSFLVETFVSLLLFVRP